MKNHFDLSGQHILITGAGGGIGNATARVCAALGASLVISDLAAPKALADELGPAVRAVALDNASRSAVAAVFSDVGPLDALVDCSGLYAAGSWQSPEDEWDALLARTMEVNVRGPVNLLRACLPGMVKRGKGRVVLTGSMAARNGGSTVAVEPAYVASKGALHSLVRYFSRQVAADGVVVNGIAPGPILTPTLIATNQPYSPDNYPMKRMGQPDEIAWPIAFLCSGATSFMTGTVIDVNGGMAFS